jgi:hypothetical protein
MVDEPLQILQGKEKVNHGDFNFFSPFHRQRRPCYYLSPASRMGGWVE